jgi:hypothetical protein
LPIATSSTSLQSTSPSPNIRRRQSPNGCPPPEWARDRRRAARRRRRGMRGCAYGRDGVFAARPRDAPSASAARHFRRTRPNAERRRQTPGGREIGPRAFCREYPSNCCSQTDADSRMRGAGQICICRSIAEYRSSLQPPAGLKRAFELRLSACSRRVLIIQSRVRHGVARFGDNVGAYPAERPAGPCRQTHQRPPVNARMRVHAHTSMLTRPCAKSVRARIRPVRMRCRGVPDKPPSRSMPSDASVSAHRF